MNYRHFIQGWIYSTLPPEGFGAFLHDTGYAGSEKNFKLFVFSDLRGKYEIKNRQILFPGTVSLEIASVSEELIQYLYQALLKHPGVLLGNQNFEVLQVRMQSTQFFPGIKEVEIETISPVTAYRFEEGKFLYFAPGSVAFEEICKQNLVRKLEVLPAFQKDEICFSIKQILSSRKQIVYFKNTFYEAYNTKMLIEVNFQTLDLLLNTGLSSKGSAGFGMVRLVEEHKHFSGKPALQVKPYE